ncbi:MAG: TonB-dependent receptor domain-containing protein [Rhodospirillaceae bacterium]
MTVLMTARRAALASVSTAALLAVSTIAGSHAAYAQGAPQAAQAPVVEEIVVTGTRVVRDGYEAPTPLTVVGAEEISKQATGNIAEFVNTMPTFAGSLAPTSTQASVSNGQAGVSGLNLRNLGTVRTLVLMDGQRSVGSIITGVVDANALPQQLISRVDVVTGGASAAYGSDALSGVVNFILDKKFTGFKGEISGGVTTYGDDRNWKVALSDGFDFAGGRGHVLLSMELVGKDGILTSGGRAWNRVGAGIILNPAYGTGAGQSTSVPQRLFYPNSVSQDNAAPGGIITAGPLKGIAFGPGGTPYQFNYGPVANTADMYGGDWRSTVQRDYRGNSIDDQEARQGFFTRVSYQVTDNFEVYGQASWNGTRTFIYCCPQFNQANISIKADNAFIPPAVAAQIAANKLTSITMGSWHADLPVIATNNRRRVQRFVVGADGKFDAMDTAWTWDAYFQAGMSLSSSRVPYATRKSRFALAIDAVRGPNGQIVCRSTLTDPTNGCVPYNVFGIGVNSAASLTYMSNNQEGPFIDQDLVQDVTAATLRGEPFSDWAGPISLATGIEHRREAVRGYSDAGSRANDYFVGNYLATTGSFTITEGFVETVIPLAKDVVWARSFDLNAAVRATGYSTSGYVTTWKVGATWQAIDSLRLRATRSRDIREPTLQDLYAAGTQNTNNVNDPFNNNVLTSYQGNAIGNSALTPEVADTTGLGFVLQPTFFPGFNASFDYYNIDIAGAIGSVSAQQTVDLCFAGQQLFCNQIQRGLVNGTNQIVRITIAPLNFVVESARGYDIEASYTAQLDNIVSSWNGNLSLRFLATHYIKDTSATGVIGSIPTVKAGTVDNPTWRWTASVNYAFDPITFSLSARGRNATHYSNNNGIALVVCTSGCPVSTANNPTINNDHIDGAVYWDTAFTYKVAEGVDAFLNIRNLMNKDPAVVAPGPTGTPVYSLMSSCSNFDCNGRTFRAGVRFKY